MKRARSRPAQPPPAHIVGAPGGAAALVMELPIIAPGTQAYTCAVSCGGGCCTYFSLPLDTPRTDRDFDDVRWYLMHDDTHVYKLEGTWFLLSMRRCKYLRPDNLCGNYDARPEICREYDPGTCEFTGTVPYDLYFKDDLELTAWLTQRKKERRARAAAKRARPGRSIVRAGSRA